jgi:hypothetical protein
MQTMTAWLKIWNPVGSWWFRLFMVGVAITHLAPSASAQQSADSLARELSNPLANLTIVPFQLIVLKKSLVEWM